MFIKIRRLLIVLLVCIAFYSLFIEPNLIKINEVSIESARQIAKKALTFTTTQDVHRYLKKAVSKLISWDISSYAGEIAPADGPV